MSLTILDLLFWGLIIWYGWKTIQKIRKGQGPGPGANFSTTGENGRPLTDTQLHYRQQQALMKLDSKHHNDLLSEHFTPDQQRVIDAGLYIQNNIRPFHWMTWLFVPVDHRMVFRYIFNMAMILGVMVAVPLYMGWPVYSLMAVGFVIASDLLMERQQRILEVTTWDPEFQRRFVKRTK